ncbi:hypothetical protein BDZ91DRAFT_479012 [Kalaharituber pfeilii]|nr:hypothetical protein BDZ91DRAFT_479012 [Kalaharituber pfeilii]
MLHQTLCDAAIACSTILTAYGISHAFFGGFAILEICRLNSPTYRESKDVDCLVSGDKDEVVKIFEGRSDWMLIPQTREDYVAFFWKNPAGGEMVLVELFVGSKESQVPKFHLHDITSPLFGKATIPILSAEALFRGKLNACATRSKESDVSDLMFLLTKFPQEAKAGGKKVGRKVIAAAISRWPELKSVLEKSGAPVKSKLFTIVDSCYTQAGRISEGDVHRGLGCAW